MVVRNPWRKAAFQCTIVHQIRTRASLATAGRIGTYQDTRPSTDICTDGGPQDDAKGDELCFQTVVLTSTQIGESLNSTGYRASGGQERKE